MLGDDMIISWDFGNDKNVTGEPTYLRFVREEYNGPLFQKNQKLCRNCSGKGIRLYDTFFHWR